MTEIEGSVCLFNVEQSLMGAEMSAQQINRDWDEGFLQHQMDKKFILKKFQKLHLLWQRRAEKGETKNDDSIQTFPSSPLPPAHCWVVYLIILLLCVVSLQYFVDPENDYLA